MVPVKTRAIKKANLDKVPQIPFSGYQIFTAGIRGRKGLDGEGDPIVAFVFLISTNSVEVSPEQNKNWQT